MKNRSLRTRDKTWWMKLGHWSTSRWQKVNFATSGAIMKTFGVSVWLLERSSGHLGWPGKPPKGGASPTQENTKHTCFQIWFWKRQKRFQNGTNIIPKWIQNEQNGTQMDHKWASPEASEWTRRRQDGSRGAKMASRRSQEVPKKSQMAQRGTKMPPKRPKMDPRGPKMAPKGPKMVPRWAQDGPKRFQKEPKWVLKLNLTCFCCI